MKKIFILVFFLISTHSFAATKALTNQTNRSPLLAPPQISQTLSNPPHTHQKVTPKPPLTSLDNPDNPSIHPPATPKIDNLTRRYPPLL